MKTTLLALSLFSFTVFAHHECDYSANTKNKTLSWTAYKTPKKVGVKGSFTKFDITATKSKSINELIKSATFSINSQSVETGDKARDAKIMQFFFKSMLKGTKITGKVLRIDNSKAQVEITMNGKTGTIEMAINYDEAKNNAILSGTIDVMNFAMEKNLAALTKACMEKHEGKTWSDVNVELSTEITKNCPDHK